MRILSSLRIECATESAIARAALLIQSGKLVAFPTETVYGLGADARNDQAIAAVFSVKGRPRFNPLIIHVASIELALDLVELDARALALAGQFWPGPLTIVARRRRFCPISPLATAGLETMAVRVPEHSVAIALLEQSRAPVAAPSANRSGRLSPTMAIHVADSLGESVDLILDGGPCRIGLESTVIDLSNPHSATLLRSGSITVEAIVNLIGPLSEKNNKDTCCPIIAPGMLVKHYAPIRPLRLNAKTILLGEVLLGFGRVQGATLNLSLRADLAEASTNLFSMLWELDHLAVTATAIAVSPIPACGLGIAINDRLQRGATN